MPKKYIVAHNRDRDFYQVAAALAEVGQLERLVTDYYRPDREIIPTPLRHRHSDFIPAALTKTVWPAVALQSLRRQIDRTGLDTIHHTNRIIGAAARSVARKSPGVDLLLYSTYAMEAFNDPKLSDREKTLFLFHPHPGLIEEILRPNIEEYGIGHRGLEEETAVAHRIAVLDAELAAADRVLCASLLTARSAIRVGVASDRVHIVPYGIARPKPQSIKLEQANGEMKFLFVGQAIHRKGVHHLLAAWRLAKLGNATLSMVCSRAQDGLLDDLPDNVTVKAGLSSQELWNEYTSADVFVLPSLVEGFGLVLLEALSAGCFTIFTENTGLANLGVPQNIGMESKAGDTKALASALEAAAHFYESNAIDREAIIQYSENFSASNFRDGIRSALQA
ncbi:glycosyltransferase [Pseudoroseicyclus sp. H15]